MVYADLVLADNPRAYYKLDEAGATAADSSGNGFDGTYENAPAKVAAIVQTSLGAHQFVRASAQQVDLVGSGLDTAFLAAAPGWSMEAWLRMDATADDAAFFGSWAVGGDGGPMFWTNVTFWATNRGTSGDYIDTGVAQVNGNLYHLVYTFDGTNIVIYVNNVVTNTVPWPAGFAGLTDAWAIGTYAGGLGGYANATISDCAAYEYALTEEQVDTHFQAGKNGVFPSVGNDPAPFPPMISGRGAA